jgi:hypothetical protein
LFVAFSRVKCKNPSTKKCKKSLIKPASSFQFSDNLGPKAPRRSTSPCRAATSLVIPIAISGDYKFSRGEHCGACKITFVTFTQVVFLLLFLASNAKIALIKPASSFQFSGGR